MGCEIMPSTIKSRASYHRENGELFQKDEVTWKLAVINHRNGFHSPRSRLKNSHTWGWKVTHEGAGVCASLKTECTRGIKEM
jgi:hypothetical protein